MTSTDPETIPDLDVEAPRVGAPSECPHEGGLAFRLRGVLQSSSSYATRSHKMLQAQINLLERQLCETRRLLKHQRREEEEEKQTRGTVRDEMTPCDYSDKTDYGTLYDTTAPLIRANGDINNDDEGNEKAGPDCSIPPVICMPQYHSETNQSIDTLQSYTSRNAGGDSNSFLSSFLHHGEATLHHVIDDAISHVKSEEDFNNEEINQDSELYLKSTFMERGTS